MKQSLNDPAETKPPVNISASAAAQATFQDGLALHQEGYLKEAKSAYEKALQIQPQHFDSLHMLGVMAGQLRAHGLAAKIISKAIEINPHAAEPHYNLGRALQEAREYEAALQSYDRAIAIQPDYSVAIENRGTVLLELNRLHEALASYQMAVKTAPHNPTLHNNLSEAWRRLGQFDVALASCEQAIRLKPDYSEAYNNRGNTLQELKRLGEALESYDRALRLKPDYAEAHYNRGNTLQELGRREEALESYDHAIKLKSDYAEAYNNRGNTLKELGRLDEALESYDQAIKLKTDYAEAHNNRGKTLKDLKRMEEALESYDQAIKLKTNYADGHWNRALCCLSMGDFARGWEGYEWRWKSEKTGLKKRRMTREWSGEKLKGSLLVMSEQGVGDEIFYSGMLNDLQSYAESITVCVDSRLVKLYQRSFDRIKVIPSSALNPGMHFDAQVYMASLGRYFRQTSSAFHNIKVPYLRPCAGRVQKLRSQIRGGKRLSCGLSWISKNAGIGAEKSLRLKDLDSILKLPDIDFVDLQYGDTSQEQSELHVATGIALTRITEIDNFNDIDGLAALIESCDVVVTVSNTTAHLAAALGKPVFIMLPFSTGLLWYWHIDRADSPWYPIARLFRQERSADWSGVIQRISQALRELTPVTSSNG